MPPIAFRFVTTVVVVPSASRRTIDWLPAPNEPCPTKSDVPTTARSAGVDAGERHRADDVGRLGDDGGLRRAERERRYDDGQQRKRRKKRVRMRSSSTPLPVTSRWALASADAGCGRRRSTNARDVGADAGRPPSSATTLGQALARSSLVRDCVRSSWPPRPHFPEGRLSKDASRARSPGSSATY